MTDTEEDLVGKPIDQVPKRDPDDDNCNGRRTDRRDGETVFVGYCDLTPGWGTDHVGEGRCKHHDAPGGAREGAGAPPKNQNARTHGLHADPANVLDDLAERDPEGYEWVMSKYDGYLADAPFEDGSAKADQLKHIATQEFIIWKATGFQLKGGVVRQTDEGGVEESPVNLPLDRMQRTVTRRLKELGILDDPDTQQAQAEAGKAAALSEMMRAVDNAPETEVRTDE
jgi:hypothetical protein